jgi:hypothetical protein
MSPDFSNETVETIAKRAAFKCSNPDCRVNTIGPDSVETKTVKIGEAAHIFGARKGAKRFNPEMTDVARAEITNAIWLCRNCHKIIDTDERKYTHNLLFKWREIHEEYITSQLGTKTDLLIYEEQKTHLEEFKIYHPIIKRIIIDKPKAWEYQLTAELLRTLNKPLFRKLKDLRSGLYLKEVKFIEEELAFNWIQNRVTEMTNLIMPMQGLFKVLNESWGKPGEAGDEKEIHHVTKLIKDYIEQIINFEEKLRFSVLPEDFKALASLLENAIGSQIEKLSIIPDKLDGIIEFAKNFDKETDEPITIQETIEFNLPEKWNEQFTMELERLKYKLIK